MRAIFFGASIVSGCWDEKGGWVNRLKEDFYRNDDQVYNLGISSDTSENLVQRIENELSARAKERHEVLTVISIGGNDSLYLRDEERCWVPKKEYRENLEKILDTVEKYSDHLVFVEGPPYDQSRVKPLEWNETRSYDNQRKKEYMEIAREICRERGIAFIPVMDRLGEHYLETLTDGVHPGDRGHEKIHEIVREGLEQEGYL